MKYILKYTGKVTKITGVWTGYIFSLTASDAKVFESYSLAEQEAFSILESKNVAVDIIPIP